MTDTQVKPSERSAGEKKQDVYRAWTLCDFWTLSEAVSLLLTDRPKPPGHGETDSPLPRGAAVTEAIAKRCAGGSLAVIRADGLPDSLCVRPREFLEWAEQKGMDVPGELRRAVDELGSWAGKHRPT